MLQFHSRSARISRGVFREYPNVGRDLSNFSAYSVEFEGKEFPTVEHAFQAAKYRFVVIAPVEVDDIIEEIRGLATAQEAKSAGGKGGMKSRRVALDIIRWDAHKDAIMNSLLQSKMMRHRLIQEELMLAKMHQIQLVHFSRADKYWGAVVKDDGRIVGENRLGALWMDLSIPLR